MPGSINLDAFRSPQSHCRNGIRVCLLVVGCGVIGCLEISSPKPSAAQENFSGSLVFPLDRDAQRAVARAEEQFQRGDFTAGLIGLQALLDQPTDSLILRNGTYRSTWETANGLIGEFLKTDRGLYERTIGERARRMLAAARARPGGDLLRRLTDQYRHAHAGREAAIQLVLMAANQGDIEAAAQWLALLEEVTPAESMSPSLAHVRRQVTSILPQNGKRDAPRESAGIRVGLPDTAWRVDFGLSRPTKRLIGEAVGEFAAQALNPIGTSRPLIVDRRIVARTLTGVLCVDAVTGERRWEYDVPSLTGGVAGRSAAADRPDAWQRAPAMLLRRILRDSLQDEMTTDGRRVFLVMGSDEAAERGAMSNLLGAIDVSTGRIDWQLGTDRIIAAMQTLDRPRELRTSEGLHFLGPPLVDGNRLLIAAQHGNQIELLALDRRTGQSLWTIPIGTTVRDLNEDRERRSTACRLSQQGRLVFCPTSAGGVACVDVLKRRILWAYRYPRSDLPQLAEPEGDRTPSRDMPTADSWLVAEAQRIGNRVVCVSPESDALEILNAKTGVLVWSRPRGQGLAVLPVGDEGFLIAGASSVTAVNVADGSVRWHTPTDRLAGSGVIVDDRLVIPTISGRLQSVRLEDGSLSDPANTANRTTVPFQIRVHPRRRWESVSLRNLAAEQDLLISQSPTHLERIHRGRADDEASSAAAPKLPRSLARTLSAAITVRTKLHPIVLLFREHDIRIALVDSALTATFEAAGLQASSTERIAELVDEWDRSRQQGPVSSAVLALRKLQTYDLKRFSRISHDESWSCRLDCWIRGRQEDDAASDSQRDRVLVHGGDGGRDPTKCDAVEMHAGSVPEWPRARPIVIDRESDTEPSYFVPVPMTVTPESPWNGVTIEVDRHGLSVRFHHASQPKPASFTLPRGSGSHRLTWSFLHGWARGDVLVLRVGTELMAFQWPAGDELPDVPLWPSRGKTLSLLGPAPLLNVLRKPDAESVQRWNPASPEQEDAFGRRIGEVGPVRRDFLCYQQRGHLIALDTRTGGELWRRSRLPVGTRVVGDDDHVVLLRRNAGTVAVLRSVDGQQVHRWHWQQTAEENNSREVSPADLRLVRGTWGLFVRATGAELAAHALDLSSGTVMWQRNFAEHAQVFPVHDCLFGVIIPPNEGTAGVMQFLDWRSGASVSTAEVFVPADLQQVFSFSDADTGYVIVTRQVTDRSLLRARQIRDGFRRPAVNGWLHAYALPTGTLRWQQRLDNLACPLDQPRHLPVLLANDVVQLDDRRSPTGRLRCLDKRTGETLVSLSAPLHIYYAHQSDLAVSEMAIRMKGRTIQLDYRGHESPAAPSP